MYELNLVGKQQDLESLYNKNLAVTRIKTEILKADFDFIAFFHEIDIPEKFGMNLLVQMVLHKRAHVTTLVGLLRHHADSTQHAADLLGIAVDSGLVDFDPSRDEFIVAADISSAVQDDLDRYQYPLPMIIPPKKIRDNYTSGYLTNNSSVILKNNHHNEDVVLDHLDRMNRIPLRINKDVVENVSNTWRNIDKQKEGETYADFRKRREAFGKYNRTVMDVIDVVTEHSETVYLTHKYDKRGRTYCQGYHINYSGNDWNKATVEFAEGEVLN